MPLWTGENLLFQKTMGKRLTHGVFDRSECAQRPDKTRRRFTHQTKIRERRIF